jgi:hypothetical protein
MNRACAKSAGGRNSRRAVANRRKARSGRAIQITNEPISADGAKLVEIPLFPRRAYFQIGSMTTSSRRATQGGWAFSRNDNSVEYVSRRECDQNDAGAALKHSWGTKRYLTSSGATSQRTLAGRFDCRRADHSSFEARTIANTTDWR